MIKQILIVVILFLIAALLLMWLWAGGGFKAIKQTVAGIPNPIDLIWGDVEGQYKIKLPWEPEYPQGPDLTEYAEENSDEQRESVPGSETPGTVQSYGNPSPYVGKISLARGGATESTVADEYLVLDATGEGTSGVPISGWTVQSMLSNIRGFVPQAASPFVLGTVNRVGPIVLRSGESVVLSSGISPVGVSFRESRCTGYLAQAQKFEPALSNACPSREEILPANATNLKKYGESCFEYLRTLPQCDFPTRMPSSLSSECQSLISSTFSYNGCLSAMQGSANFNLETHRAYLGFTKEIWGNTHDTIRLTDSEGRTVDVVTY